VGFDCEQNEPVQARCSRVWRPVFRRVAGAFVGQPVMWIARRPRTSSMHGATAISGWAESTSGRVINAGARGLCERCSVSILV